LSGDIQIRALTSLYFAPDICSLRPPAGAYYGTDANWCVDDKCFVAGAPKITPDVSAPHATHEPL
jgi:hypothetical protein